MDTLPPQDKSHSANIDNHMNHFMVKAAHDLANFLAQPPQNIPPAVTDQGAIQMEVVEDDSPKGENESGSNTMKTPEKDDAKSNEESVHDKATNNANEKEEGHVEGSQVESSPQETDSRNEDEPGKPSNEHGGNIPPSDSQGPENVPNGTYVVKTDDKGNVSTSMSWIWSTKKK